MLDFTSPQDTYPRSTSYAENADRAARATRAEYLSPLFKKSGKSVIEEPVRTAVYVWKHPFIPAQIGATAAMGLSGALEYSVTGREEALGRAITGFSNAARNVGWLAAVPIARHNIGKTRFDKRVSEATAKGWGAGLAAGTNLPQFIFAGYSLAFNSASNAAAMFDVAGAMMAMAAYGAMAANKKREIGLMRAHSQKLNFLYTKSAVLRRQITAIISEKCYFETMGYSRASLSDKQRQNVINRFADDPDKQNKLIALFAKEKAIHDKTQAIVDEILKPANTQEAILYQWLPGTLLSLRGASFTISGLMIAASAASPFAGLAFAAAGVIFTAAGLYDLKDNTGFSLGAQFKKARDAYFLGHLADDHPKRRKDQKPAESTLPTDRSPPSLS